MFEIFMSYELTNTSIKLNVEDNIYTLRRIKRVNLSKFKEKYEIVLQKFMICDAAVGNFLSDEQNVNYLIDLCKLIPCDETEDKHFNFEYIEDDYALIAILFLSESFNEVELEYKVTEGETFKPSAICRFHVWNYNEAMGKAQMIAIEGNLKKEEEMIEKQETLRKKAQSLKTKREKLTTT